MASCIVNYKGEVGPLKTMCKRHGFVYDTVKARMNRGMSFEEAISVPSLREPVLYTVDGVARTLRKHCEFYGINYYTVRSRLANGADIEEALQLPLFRPTKRRSFTYKGKTGGIGTLCQEFGVSYQTVHFNMKRGMSFEEAMDHCLNNRKR